MLAAQGPGRLADLQPPRRADQEERQGRQEGGARDQPGRDQGQGQQAGGQEGQARGQEGQVDRQVDVKRIKVIRGDTLAKIAKRYHVKGGWRGLWKLNKKTLKNPNRIYVGQVLRIR